MHHGHDFQMIVALAIDDPVRPGQQLTQVVVRILRHPAAALRDGLQLNDTVNQASDQRVCISRRVLCNVFLNGGKLGLRLGRPDNGHSARPRDSSKASLV